MIISKTQGFIMGSWNTFLHTLAAIISLEIIGKAKAISVDSTSIPDFAFKSSNNTVSSI